MDVSVLLVVLLYSGIVESVGNSIQLNLNFVLNNPIQRTLLIENLHSISPNIPVLSLLSTPTHHLPHKTWGQNRPLLLSY